MIYFSNFQNDRPSLTEVLGELLPVYNLDLYEAIGNEAQNSGKASIATEWYTRGLSMARELRDHEKIKLFKELIIGSIKTNEFSEEKSTDFDIRNGK